MVFGLSAAILAAYYLRKAREVLVGGVDPEKASTMKDFADDMWEAMLARYAPVVPVTA